MTMTTPRGPESTVLRMVGNAMHIQNIEVETGWTPDEIKAVAVRNGYALDAASKRFRRAPQPKPAPVGIVRTSQTSTGAADTDLPTSGPMQPRGTNRGADGGEPSPSAPVLTETTGAAIDAGPPAREATHSPIAAPVSARAEVQAAWLVFFQSFNELIRVIESAPAPALPTPTNKRTGNYPTGPRLTHGASQSQVRDWARTQGLNVNPRGTVRRDIADAYAAAHPQEAP